MQAELMTIRPATSVTASREAPSITLHRFGPFFGTPDASPFVIKAMLLLAFAGLPYRAVPGNLLKAPKKLLPYIDDAGETVADSALIRRHLERKYGVDFDAGLGAAQRATAWAIERMCEDHLYFAMLEMRWLDRDNFKNGVGTVFDALPFPVRPFIKRMLLRANRARLHGHGLGRHASADIAELAIRDIDALASLFADRPYLMGERPCGADAFVFGIVTAILTPPLKSPLRTAIARHANLVAYRDRLTRRYFPELPT